MMRLGIARPDLECPLIMRDCLINAVQGLQGKAEAEMGLRVVGADCERLPVMLDGPRGLLLRLQSNAEAVMGIGVVRPMVTRFADQADRLVDATPLQQDETEIVEGIKVIAVLPQHPSIKKLGLVMQPLLMESECRLIRLQRRERRGMRSDERGLRGKDQ